MKKVLKRLKTWQLLLGLFLVIGLSTLFIVGVSGGFGGAKASLDSEYLCGASACEFEYMELEPSDYESLVKDEKSFVVFVDQDGCTTADKVEGFLKDFASHNGFKAYKMMFGDVKKTSLYDFVKYYPSVVVVSKGKVIGYLRADANEDSDAYNKSEAFDEWIRKYLK